MYQKRFDSCFSGFVRQLRSMTEAARRRALSWFLIIHSENPVFAPSLVESLTPDLRSTIVRVFVETVYSAIPYQELPDLDLLSKPL